MVTGKVGCDTQHVVVYLMFYACERVAFDLIRFNQASDLLLTLQFLETS
jgi:hypothetical protein